MAAAPGEVFDLTINLGHLITISGVLVTAVLGYAALKNAVANLAGRATQLDDKLVEMKTTMTERAGKSDARIDSVIVDMKKMTDVLVQIGRQEERLNSMDQRMLMQGSRHDDMSAQLGHLRDDYIALLAEKAQRIINDRSLPTK